MKSGSITRWLCLAALIFFFLTWRAPLVRATFEGGWEWNYLPYNYFLQVAFDSFLRRAWPASFYLSLATGLIALSVVTTGLLALVRPSSKLLLPMATSSLGISVVGITVVYALVFRAYGLGGRQAIVELKTGAYLLGVSVLLELTGGLVSKFYRPRAVSAVPAMRGEGREGIAADSE